MTIGAIVLDWFQPDRPIVGSSTLQLVARIQDAIQPSAQRNPSERPWQEIQIAPLNLADRADWHFIVEEDGQFAPTESWQTQRTVGDQGVVRIGLRTPDDSRRVTPKQWQETVQLVRSLQHMYDIPSQRTVPSRLLSAIRPVGGSPPRPAR